jgi:hypothetical protein
MTLAMIDPRQAWCVCGKHYYSWRQRRWVALDTAGPRILPASDLLWCMDDRGPFVHPATLN